MTDTKPAKPVLMLVNATITDRVAYDRYMQAMISSGLLPAHGAQPLVSGPALEYLEGDGPDDIAAIMRFPSQQAAHDFWYGAAYREIAKLREQAGDFRIGLWRILPQPN